MPQKKPQEKNFPVNSSKKPIKTCAAASKCGGCSYQGISYAKQLELKQKEAEHCLKKYGNVEPVIGMTDPFYYRNKVHCAFSRNKKGEIICGTYEENSHRVVTVDECLIEDLKSQQIIRTIRDMLRSFRITIYDEDSGYGLLRHVLVRKGFRSGEIMVILVASSPIFPSKNNFVKALRQKYPEITTVILNVNEKRTSMVLGERNIVLFGPGFIYDSLCGCRFRISPDAFYQVNPVQTEILYRTAAAFAGLTGKETILDAYCGTGTIGIIASRDAASVISVELNKNAVKDAIVNARLNNVRNIRFCQADAGEFMKQQVSSGQKADVVFMDPPRSGASEAFLRSLVTYHPARIVYVSCSLETLSRDLSFLTKHQYRVERIQPVDMFPFTSSIESIVSLERTT